MTQVVQRPVLEIVTFHVIGVLPGDVQAVAGGLVYLTQVQLLDPFFWQRPSFTRVRLALGFVSHQIDDVILELDAQEFAGPGAKGHAHAMHPFPAWIFDAAPDRQ